MKKIILIIIGTMFLPYAAWAAISYSRSPSGSSIQNPVTFNISFDNWADIQCDNWGLAVCAENSGCNPWDILEVQPSSVLSHTFSVNLTPGNYSAVYLGCSQGGIDTLLEGDEAGNNFLFSVIPGSASAGAGKVVYMPAIKLLTSFLAPLGEKIFSGKLPIDYEASDMDDTKGHFDNGLSSAPVSFYYSLPRSFDWNPISDNLPATGTVSWDTSKLPDGNGYGLKARVVDKDMLPGQAIIENITLDNTKPFFKVSASPTFSKGTPVEIKIESSEILKTVPVMTVTQANYEPAKVALAGDVLGKIFEGQYGIISGFDGQAKIFVSGEDLAGNKGTAIVGNDAFWVGVNPPQPPTIEAPENNIKINEPVISAIKGFGLNAEKIVLKINGAKEYIRENLKDGYFKFEKIELDPNFNKGKNIISVVSYDKGGAISEPRTVEIFVNSPPKVSLLEPRGRLLKLNGSIRFHWEALDINGDVLKYSVELSDNGVQTWKTLARDINKKEFIWDSIAVPDGSNYLIRITASDGSLNSSVLSNKISVINDLPAIVLEESGDIFTSLKSKVFKGIVRSKNDLLVKLDLSSDNGRTWKAVLPDNTKWDSNFERFSFVLETQKAGEQKIILRGITVSKKAVVNAQGLKIIFDDVAPVISAENLSSKIITTKSLSMGGIARDNFSGIKEIDYQIDGSGWYKGMLEGEIGIKNTEFRINHPGVLSDGKHKIAVKAVDMADNSSKTIVQNFSVDATPPRIGSFALRTSGKIIFPNKDGVFEISPETSVNVYLAVLGEIKRADMRLNDKKLDLKLNKLTGLWESSFILFREGLMSLKIEAEDSVGNKTEKELAKIATAPNTQNLSGKEPPKQSFWGKLINFFRKTK